MIVRPSGYCVEVEIKVSAADIKRDRLKHHQHRHRLLRQSWFAVPESLSQHPDIPEAAGVIAVTENEHGQKYCTTVRAGAINKDAVKLSDKQVRDLGRLAAMRIWTLKAALNDRCRELSELKRK